MTRTRAFTRRVLWTFAAALALGGCGAPVFSAQLRVNAYPADTPIATRCFYWDNPYYSHHMNEMSQYVTERHMRLAYVSHYTSDKTLAFHVKRQ